MRNIIAFLLLISLKSYSQQSDTTLLDELLIFDKGRDITDESGQRVSCNGRLECRGMYVRFYEVFFDKDLKRMRIRGRVYVMAGMDTIGLEGVQIAISSITKDRIILKNKRTSYTAIRDEDHPPGKDFPHRTGDFEMSFHFEKNESIFFADRQYYLLEYRIGELIKE